MTNQRKEKIMNTCYGKNHLFLCNCVIVYLLCAWFAVFVADFHENYQKSQQANNAENFSRIISLGVAYQAKQVFTEK